MFFVFFFPSWILHDITVFILFFQKDEIFINFIVFFQL